MEFTDYFEYLEADTSNVSLSVTYICHQAVVRKLDLFEFDLFSAPHRACNARKRSQVSNVNKRAGAIEEKALVSCKVLPLSIGLLCVSFEGH